MCRGIGSKDHCLDDHGQRSHDRHTPHPSVSPAEQILLTIAFVWNSVLIIHTNDVQHGKERTQTHTTGKVSKSFVAHTPPPPPTRIAWSAHQSTCSEAAVCMPSAGRGKPGEVMGLGTDARMALRSG